MRKALKRHRPARNIKKNELDAQHLEAAADTVADGNCGLDGFGISLIDEATHNRALYSTNKYKKFRAASKRPNEKVDHLRSVARQWMETHAEDMVWDGMPFKDLAVMMAGRKGRASSTYVEVIKSIATDKEWIDCSCLLALACHFVVDVLIFQEGMDPVIVGCSLMEKAPFGMLTMAMVNDHHFWGVRAVRVALPTTQPPNGDPIHIPQEIDRADRAQPAGGSDDELDLNQWHRDNVQPLIPHINAADVEKEFTMCDVLTSWTPFDEPNDRLIAALGNLTTVTAPRHEGQRLLLRQSMIEQLMYEKSHADTLPECMRHHAAARYRLRNNRLTTDCAKRNTTWADLRVPSVEDLRAHLEQPCDDKHSCLDVFRGQPQIVRNWRVLWLSNPAAFRREMLMKFHADDLRAYQASGNQGRWHVKYKFMGLRVCRVAFLLLTGLGASSLMKAREAAMQGKQSSLSRVDLQLHRRIANTNKENLYIDARQWLEHYADTHGDHSPMDCLTFLPCGRKRFYYNQYVFNKNQQKRRFAGWSVFEEAWRVDVFWLVIAHSISKFSKCGTCEYLRWLIDRTLRSDTLSMMMYVARLGEHFDFQSAQRLIVARIEELCLQSGSTKWLMLIDKMDQHTTNLPTIWELMRSAFFKEGERVQMSIIGAWFFGPIHSPGLCLRSVFEDIGLHGANMQASTLLLNLHDRVKQEGDLPEEWFINADNTSKETKNMCCIRFIIWLLINLDGTKLWCVTLLFLIVGHTHNKLDRIFSILKRCLRGHPYCTREQAFKIMADALQGFTMDHHHLSDVWDWWAIGDALGAPHIKHLARVHAICIFRHSGAVMIKWKQYLTSPSWSRPIMLIPPHLVAAYKDYRPPRLPKAFKKEFVSSHMTWLLNLQTLLAGRQGDNHDGDIDSIKRMVLKSDTQYDDRFDLDQILADLKNAGRAPSTVLVPLKMPDDVLVQTFPGGDHVEMPADCLLDVPDVWSPTRPTPIAPTSMVICSQTCDILGLEVPFTMGVIVAPVDLTGDLDVVIQWWVPPTDKERIAGGRTRMTVDLFGQWHPFDQIATADMENYKMPPASVRRSSILLGPVDLDDDGKITFQMLDKLADLGLDLTGLRLSARMPFPQEHDMMLGQEMIGVFDADVVIAFDVGSGELLKAVLMQKIFGIGI